MCLQLGTPIAFLANSASTLSQHCPLYLGTSSMGYSPMSDQDPLRRASRLHSVPKGQRRTRASCARPAVFIRMDGSPRPTPRSHARVPRLPNGSTSLTRCLVGSERHTRLVLWRRIGLMCRSKAIASRRTVGRLRGWEWKPRSLERS
jgi:hypothetical protein